MKNIFDEYNCYFLLILLSVIEFYFLFLKCFYYFFLDCYNATEIQYGNVDFVELRDSSPQLCQEHCLRKNKSLFAVQVCE